MSDEENEDGDSADDDGKSNSNHFWLLKDGHEDKEAADEEEEDGKDDVDSDGSLQVRLLPSEIEHCGDWDHDEEGLHEWGEVDEDEDIRGGEEEQGDDAQEDEAGDGGEVLEVDQGQTPGHVSTTGTNKEQSGAGKDPWNNEPDVKLKQAS